MQLMGASLLLRLQVQGGCPYPPHEFWHKIHPRWLSDSRISLVINLCSSGDQPLTAPKRKETHDHSVSSGVVSPEIMVIWFVWFLRMMLPDVDDAKMQPL